MCKILKEEKNTFLYFQLEGFCVYSILLLSEAGQAPLAAAIHSLLVFVALLSC